MRVWLALSVVLLLAGCGGSGGVPAPLASHTATADTLVVSYSHWVITVPQDTGGDASQDFFTYAARLWMAPTAPLLTTVRLAPPVEALADTLNGPRTLDPADGTHAGPPDVLYWGTGDTVAAGQPRVVRAGEWQPGYVRPAESLYLYSASKDSEVTVPVSGEYRLTADGLERAWHLDGTTMMLPVAKLTTPDAIVVDTAKPLALTWADVPGALGYFVYAEGEVVDANKAVLRRVQWNVGDAPIIFSAVYDLTPYLVPATVHAATIPAKVFSGCKSIQVHVAAMAPPVTRATSPALTVLNTSLTSRVYATFGR
jgi:hypothetical protein